MTTPDITRTINKVTKLANGHLGVLMSSIGSIITELEQRDKEITDLKNHISILEDKLDTTSDRINKDLEGV